MADIIVATTLATEGFHALFSDDRRHDYSRDRVGPPPAEYSIEQEAPEQDGR